MFDKSRYHIKNTVLNSPIRKTSDSMIPLFCVLPCMTIQIHYPSNTNAFFGQKLEHFPHLIHFS